MKTPVEVDHGPSVKLIAPGGGPELSVSVEIADDDAEREKGLMFRDHLDPDAGMLFVFEQPQALSFWMKNTLIPLDIIYFDVEGEFVSSVTMTPCTQDPCPGYPSVGPAKYALEVNEGFVTEKFLGAGWSLLMQ